MDLKDIIKTLIEAQNLELEIQDLSKRKDRLPEQLKSTNQKLTDELDSLKSSDSKIKVKQIEIKKSEDEVVETEKRISELRKQQNEAKTNKDYKSFEDAIGKLKSQIDNKEETQLVLMEEIDNINSAKMKIQEKIKFQQKLLDEKKKELDDNYSNLEVKIKEHIDKEINLLSTINEQTVQQFKKLIEHRNYQAIVPVDENRICTGCASELNLPVIQKLMACNQIVACPFCSRIIYLEEIVWQDS